MTDNVGSSIDTVNYEDAVIRRRGVWRRLIRNKQAIIGIFVVACFVLCALFAPWIAPHDPYKTDLSKRLAPPSKSHWLGNDELGRDLASRLIYGARVSLMFGFVTVAIAAVVGTVLGIVSGYAGGIADTVIMRAVDLLLAFPGVLLAITIISVLGPGLANAMIAISVNAVPMFARTIRAQTLALRESEYVVAAKSLGASTVQIVGRHILPNTMAPIIVLVSLGVGTAILSASTLSFLGLGVTRPTAEWGAILSTGRSYLTSAPHLMLFPGIALSIVVIAFSSVGDALRDALDPNISKD